MRRALSLVFVVALLVSPVACVGSTKTAHGQLYQSGDGRYDAYFHAVHDQQTAANKWEEEKRASRRPIVSALSLAPESSEYTIVSAARAKKDGLSGPVDETRRNEMERAARLKAMSAHLDELTKQGKTYEEEAKKEYENRGAMKADEKKSEHAREVRRELDAAVDVSSSLSHDAKKYAQQAETFADDLAKAIGQEPGKHQPPPPPEEKKPEEKKPEPPPPPVAHKPKPPPPPPAEKPKPPPTPTEKPKPPDEVFNP